MQAVLNVKGTKLSVLSIHYSETGKVLSVYAKDENGRETRFVDKSQSQHDTTPHLAIEDLDGALEYPELEARIVEGNNRLIEHLDEMLGQEIIELSNIAIDAMESESDLPLDNHLSKKQREYKLQQQRVLGWIDAVEEVKAYTEGYYANADDGSIETQSSNPATE